MKKATHSEESSRPLRKADNTTKPLNKTARILKVMVDGGSLNRFEAEQIGYHCLNSTISTLSNSYELTFIRSWERVPNRWGSETSVIRYSLRRSEVEKARVVMAILTRSRNVTDGE